MKTTLRILLGILLSPILLPFCIVAYLAATIVFVVEGEWPEARPR